MKLSFDLMKEMVADQYLAVIELHSIHTTGEVISPVLKKSIKDEIEACQCYATFRMTIATYLSANGGGEPSPSRVDEFVLGSIVDLKCSE